MNGKMAEKARQENEAAQVAIMERNQLMIDYDDDSDSDMEVDGGGGQSTGLMFPGQPGKEQWKPTATEAPVKVVPVLLQLEVVGMPMVLLRWMSKWKNLSLAKFLIYMFRDTNYSHGSLAFALILLAIVVIVLLPLLDSMI